MLGTLREASESRGTLGFSRAGETGKAEPGLATGLAVMASELCLHGHS